jgi:hypothetical protein
VVPADPALFVEAISMADPTKTARAEVVIRPVFRIDPRSTVLRAGEEVDFQVILSGLSGDEVEWRVNDIPGGNEELGTIDSEGRYRTPSQTPTWRQVRVEAVSLARPEYRAAASVRFRQPVSLFILDGFGGVQTMQEQPE